MKTTSKHFPFPRPHGFGALPMIALITVMLTSSLVFIMRRGIASQDAAAHVQLRTDYRQREDALVRSLLAIVPNKAIGCMQNDSANNASSYTWDTIFDEAITVSNGGEQLSAAAKTALGLDTARNSNTGDKVVTASGLIVPFSSGAGTVVAGNIKSAGLVSGQTKLPPLLGGADPMLTKDIIYPIISRSKILTANDATLEYELAAAAYPLYNRVKFPQVRFGFASPGEYVVGKRNWWAFSVEYGSGSGLGTLKKNYVLSIYELPNQLPISATAETTVGAYADGSSWDASTIVTTGALFADRLTTAGAMNFDRLIGRESLQLTGSTSVGGSAMSGNFDVLGTRESMAAASGSNFLPVAVASNSGKIAFMSLKRGSDFYTEAATPIANTLSDTTWDDYTRGANQCGVKVYIKKMVDATNQTPTQIEVHYKDPGGVEQTKTFTRSGAPLAVGDPVPADYWPYNTALWLGGGGIPSGADMPFQTEVSVGIDRPMLTVYPAKLATWLTSVGAASVSDNNYPNNAVYIAPIAPPDPAADATVIAPSTPSIAGDVAVVMRESEDLSVYTKGFSVVTNLRFYLADDANQVAIAQPLNAGLPVGEAFYPPFSVSAPEYRVGTTAGARPFDIQGQIASVQNSNDTFNPLDFKSGGTDAVDSGGITADLKQIISPAQLPPVINMNWLLTIEEIH